MKINIPYSPRNWAKTLHDSEKRWNVIVAHRRSGKTTASINHLIRECFRNPEPEKRYAYIAPTYKQAKNIAWDMVKKYAKVIPKTTFNEAELRVDFPNGARITLYGAENVDALRGIGLWGVIYDEYSQQPSNIHSEVVSKCLADHKGFAIWIGTPKGKNSFYELFKTAQISPDRYLSILWTVDETFANETGKTIENIKAAVEEDKIQVKEGIMTDDEFQQEWYCSFDAALKGAYYADELSRARGEKRIGNVPHDPQVGVTTAWDLGVGDSTAIGFFQKVGQENRMIDYYENHGLGLDHYIKVLQEKPYVYDRHIAPHDIAQRELTTGISRLETAERLGIGFEVLERQSIEDGIHAVRMLFPKLWIDQNKCADFLNAISQYSKEWDEGRGEFKPTPKKSWANHGADALRYYALGNLIEEEELEFIPLNTEY